METVIRNKQSLLDISVQEYGSIEALMDLAVENDVSLTDEFEPGDTLNLPEADGNTDVQAFYNKRQLKPATALSDADFAIVEIENCNLCNCLK